MLKARIGSKQIFAAFLCLSAAALVVITVDTASNMRTKIAELESERPMLDLATEFGYDPMIVRIVQKLSKEALASHACTCPTWRFVKTDKDLTYIVLSIIQIESRGNPKAHRTEGTDSYGLTQLILTTAQMYDKRVTPGQLLTIPKNLTIAMSHFVSLLERYQGNPTLAVVAWNRGSGAVDRSVALGDDQSNNAYAKKVFNEAAMRNGFAANAITKGFASTRGIYEINLVTKQKVSK